MLGPSPFTTPPTTAAPESPPGLHRLVRYPPAQQLAVKRKLSFDAMDAAAPAFGAAPECFSGAQARRAAL
jgi:hypothetical protein